MTSRRVSVIVFILLLSASGCVRLWTVKDLNEVQSSQSSLIFAHLDMSEAPTGVDVAQLRVGASKSDKTFLNMNVDNDGMLYLENLPPGSYQVHRFWWDVTLLGETHRYPNMDYSR